MDIEAGSLQYCLLLHFHYNRRIHIMNVYTHIDNFEGISIFVQLTSVVLDMDGLELNEGALVLIFKKFHISFELLVIFLKDVLGN